MVKAALNILKGQPIPNDSVYGLPYRWNPTTRELTALSNAAFDEMKIPLIILPESLVNLAP